MKKILLYHWIQDNFPMQRGGGIQFYQKILVTELKKRENILLTILSSGMDYDWTNLKTRIVSLPSEGPNISRFSLVNSGIPAPSVLHFGNSFAMDHQQTQNVFERFVLDHGPFDVIHFNHFEGVAPTVLTIKKKIPQTKIVFTMHDYYVLCPNVTLIYQDKDLCLDSKSGSKCLSCKPVKTDIRAMILARPIINKLGLNPRGPGGKIIRKAISMIDRFVNNRTDIAKPAEETFREWENTFRSLINENVDHLLTVSDRVRQIAVEKGFDPRILRTLHNGLDEAERFRTTVPKTGPIMPSKGPLTMIFMGYMTRHKGFWFFLDAFEKMPLSMAQKINLVIPAKKSPDRDIMNRVEALQGKLNSVKQLNGYKQNELDGILKNCDLGILAHIWNETGPYTAWEMICRRVPYLTSDLGGAPLFSNCPDLTFKHGDIDHFLERIQSVLEGKTTHGDFWKNCIEPITVKQHADRLLSVYFNDAK